MPPPSPRYTVVAHPSGVVLVDQSTGEVALVPTDATALRVLRPGRPASSAADDAPLPEDDSILRDYPWPIAASYARVLATRDPALRCHRIVECFATALRYWALLLLAEYLATDLRDGTLDAQLSPLSTPLVSTWWNLLDRALNVLADAGREPFIPTLRAALTQLATRPFLREPRLRLEDDREVVDVSGAIQLLPALLDFRNAMAHEPLPRGDRAVDLAGRYLVALRDALRLTRCVADHPLLARAPDGASALVLMGTEPRPDPLPLPGELLSGTGVFLASSDRRRVLPLDVAFELRRPPPGGALPYDLLQLEECRRDRLTYHSLSGRVVSRPWKDHPWALRLAARPAARPVRRVDVDELSAFLAHSTRERVARWSARGDWLPDLVVETRGLRGLSRFVDREPAEGPDHGGAIRGLVGPRGTGRTTALAWVADRAARHLVLLCNVAALAPARWEERVLHELGVPLRERSSLAQLCETLDAGLRQRDLRLVLLFDDVDADGSGPRLEALRRLVEPLERYPWLRVVVALREAPAGLAAVALSPYDDEELERAYERLRQRRVVGPEGEPRAVSAPTTSIESLRTLSPQARAGLAHPRTLRQLAEEFHQRPLPLGFLREEIGALQARALDERHRAVATAIARGMARGRRTAFDAEALAKMPELHASLPVTPNEGAVLALLGELRAEGLLLRDARTGDWRFASPPVFEYLLVKGEIDAVKAGWILWGLAGRWWGVAELEEALVALMVRLCQQDRLDPLLDAIDDVKPDEYDAVIGAAARCLGRLAVADADGLPRLLERLVERPTERDLAVVQTAAAATLHTAPASALHRLDATLELLAERAGSRAQGGAVRLLRARLWETLDRRDEAATVYRELEADADHATRRTARVLASWARRDRARDVGEEDFGRLREEVGESPRDATWSAMLRLGAQVAVDRQDWELARRRAREARGGGDGRERTLAALQLRWIQSRAGAHDPSTPTEPQLLAEVEALGHLDLLRRMVSTQAIERRHAGALNEALSLMATSVLHARRSGLPGPLLVALRTQGILRTEAGDLAGARSSLGESAELARAAERTHDVAAALNARAVVEYEVGDVVLARELIERVKTLPIKDEQRADALWYGWLLGRSPDDATRWASALPEEAKRSELQRAQQAAMAMDAALDRGDFEGVAGALELVDADLGRTVPRPELIDLPMPLMADAWERLRRSAPTLADRIVATARRWLQGRPSRDLRRMLPREEAARASAPPARDETPPDAGTE